MRTGRAGVSAVEGGADGGEGDGCVEEDEEGVGEEGGAVFF